MVPCDVCNDLQIDSKSNLDANESSLPEPQRLRTFLASENLHTWRRSAEDGCFTCRLVWDALVLFDRDSVLEDLVRISSTKGDDDAMYFELNGSLGQTLLVQFTQLPQGTEFPTIELYTQHSKHPPSFIHSFPTPPVASFLPF